MENVNEGENRRKRILIALLVLLLCSSSAIALGYAHSITSTTTNTENVISGEGLETRLLDLDEEVLKAGGFATGNTCWREVSHWADGVFTESDLDVFEDVLIGEALLEIKTDHKYITQVMIWYEIEWTEGSGDTKLVIDGKDPMRTYNDGENTVTIDLNEDVTLVNLKLYGTVTPEKVDEEYSAEYDITFHVLPVLP